MRFGTRVLFRRGNRRIREPWCGYLRTVRADYIGARGGLLRLRLAEDDPASRFGARKAGDVVYVERTDLCQDANVTAR